MKITERFWSKVDKRGPSECWPWTASRLAAGYGRFRVGQRHGLAHRAAWEIHYGKIDGGLWVLHRCDNPACVNPAHLFLGTHSDNQIDAARKGRKGSQRLTMDDVREMRRRYEAGGISHRALAAEYGVSHVRSVLIVNRKKWAHVD